MELDLSFYRLYLSIFVQLNKKYAVYCSTLSNPKEVLMNRKPIYIVIAVLALTTLACGITIPVQVKTGPTVTDPINVPLTPGNSQAYDVTFSFGAGNFTLNPGANGSLVSGTATYNVADFKPKVTITNNVVHVEQGNLKLGGIPNFKNNVRNDWVLQLADVPMRLTLNAGAYSGHYELGGLSLESLAVNDGAADVNLAFSSPNRVNMDTLTYKTGASNVKLTGLANAHFSELRFTSGAGDYTLDFSGQLLRDANVSVDSGLSNVNILVPAGVSAKITFTGGLTSVSTSGAWTKNGDVYTQSGSGPTLTITVKMGAGSLNIKNP